MTISPNVTQFESLDEQQARTLAQLQAMSPAQLANVAGYFTDDNEADPNNQDRFIDLAVLQGFLAGGSVTYQVAAPNDGDAAGIYSVGAAAPFQTWVSDGTTVRELDTSGVFKGYFDTAPDPTTYAAGDQIWLFNQADATDNGFYTNVEFPVGVFTWEKQEAEAGTGTGGATLTWQSTSAVMGAGLTIDMGAALPAVNSTFVQVGGASLVPTVDYTVGGQIITFVGEMVARIKAGMTVNLRYEA